MVWPGTDDGLQREGFTWSQCPRNLPYRHSFSADISLVYMKSAMFTSWNTSHEGYLVLLFGINLFLKHRRQIQLYDRTQSLKQKTNKTLADRGWDKYGTKWEETRKTCMNYPGFPQWKTWRTVDRHYIKSVNQNMSVIKTKQNKKKKNTDLV